MSHPGQKPSCRWGRAGSIAARLGTTSVLSTMTASSVSYVYLFIAIVAEVVATSFLKSSDSFTRLWPSVITVVGYAIAFLFLSLTLRTMPTGIAYAIWSGTGIVLISLVSWWWFGQNLDLPAIAGMGLIIAGVVVVNVFSKTAGH
jgi:small multidrug resistance pump